MLQKAIRLRLRYTLGDVVVLTAAVRDLHRAYPGVFRTSVETGAMEVWANNPYVSAPTFAEPVIDCSSVTVDRRGDTGKHYTQAYLDLINRRLGTSAELTSIKGDIHLSDEEKRWHSDIWGLCGREIPYWLICPGGKFDIPIKWWDHRRYQRVVDAFRGRIQFVQVGAWTNHHPELEGVIDLRGQTSIRDLIHLMYYADGVLCGVTSLMHLAAAVPTERGSERPAVIIGGAREPSSWEAYPQHEYITTEKAVDCGPCWKNSIEGRDRHRCVNPRNDLPLCMDLISAEEVIARIEHLAAQGRTRLLSSRDRAAAQRAVARAGKKTAFDRHNVNEGNAAAQAARFIQQIPPYPARRFHGRGIVICAGGVRYFTCAWVCIRMLRKLGCTLPVELWHLGRDEISREMEALLQPYDVVCVNARTVMNRHPMRNPLGWELKCYAILHSRFREVIFLDADNVPVQDPTVLFESSEYLRTGAIFWPDYGRLAPQRRIWKLCDVPYRDEPEFESGQIVVDKERSWRPLQLAFWYNDHSEFFYRHIHGDKETFHMAWRRLDQPYSMPPFPIHGIDGTMCQHDFSGRRLFQHRNTPKWQFFGPNIRVPGFLFEEECLAFIDELRARWSGQIHARPSCQCKNGFYFRKDTVDESVFVSVVMQNEYRLPQYFNRFDVVIDVGTHVGSFAIAAHSRGSRKIVCFEPNRQNYLMASRNLGSLEGVSLRRAAVLDRHAGVECDAFPWHAGALNTGGASVHVSRRGRSVRAVPLDEILREHSQVALVKLDCEGSEWPILMNSTEWPRVLAVCGEYHLGGRPPEVPVDRAPALLHQILSRHFPFVFVEVPDRCQVGRFWASRRPAYFRLGPRVQLIAP